MKNTPDPHPAKGGFGVGRVEIMQSGVIAAFPNSSNPMSKMSSLTSGSSEVNFGFGLRGGQVWDFAVLKTGSEQGKKSAVNALGQCTG